MIAAAPLPSPPYGGRMTNSRPVGRAPPARPDSRACPSVRRPGRPARSGSESGRPRPAGSGRGLQEVRGPLRRGRLRAARGQGASDRPRRAPAVRNRAGRRSQRPAGVMLTRTQIRKGAALGRPATAGWNALFAPSGPVRRPARAVATRRRRPLRPRGRPLSAGRTNRDAGVRRGDAARAASERWPAASRARRTLQSAPHAASPAGPRRNARRACAGPMARSGGWVGQGGLRPSTTPMTRTGLRAGDGDRQATVEFQSTARTGQ
jgi:hypothetical protein